MVPPDDNPFEPTPPPSPSPPDEGGEPTGEGNPEGPSPLDQLGALMDRAVHSAVGPLNQEIANLRAQLAQIQTRPTPPSEPSKPADQWIEEFVKDPDTALSSKLGSKLDAWAEERLGPHLAAFAESAQTQHIQAQRARVDSRWGPGVWDEVFSGPVQAALQDLPPHLRANGRSIESIVSLLAGSDQLSSKLESKRSEWRKKQDAERRKPPSFLGNPGRDPHTDPTEVTDEDRRAIESLQRHGYTFDEGSLKKLRGVTGKGLDIESMAKHYRG